MESNTFVRLIAKDKQTTREGKPYFRVAFGDVRTEIRFPIWADSPHFADCDKHWEVGQYYKIQGSLLSSKFGQQLDIKRIRLAEDKDRVDGFDPRQCQRASHFASEQMYNELLELAQKHCKGKIANLITHIFKAQRETILEVSAARYYHHDFLGGLLEHSLSVTKLAMRMLDHYEEMYPDKRGRISRPLVVAGGILHDIGKVQEMRIHEGMTHHTTIGDLIGHIILGRDFVRDAGREVGLDEPTRLHLEHIILSHQGKIEWGSPKPPMSMEAAIVHAADSLDAMIGVFENILLRDDSGGEMTSKKTLLGHPVYRINAAKNESK